MADIEKIFKELQDKGHINPERKLIKVPYWSSADCCMIWCFSDTDKESFGMWVLRKLYEIHPALGLVTGIYYIKEDVDKMSEESTTVILLHEEGHVRYNINHLDWNDKFIETIENQTYEDKMNGEFRADDYATRILTEYYPDIDPVLAIKGACRVHEEIGRTKKIHILLSKVERFLNKYEYGEEQYHPEIEERYTRIEQMKKLHEIGYTWKNI